MNARILATVLAVLTAVAAPAAAAAPTTAVAPFNLSQYYTQAEFERAIRPYTDAIARNPNDADAHYWLGVAYLHGYRLFRLGATSFGGDFAPRAEASLQRALVIRPGILGALLALLELYAMTGNDAKWAATLDRLVALNPPLPLK